MNEMIERVARAIATSKRAPGQRTPDVIDRAWTAYCGQARAAIEAMREPSARQLAATVMAATWDQPSEADMAITGAVLERLPPTGHPDARVVIAEMSRDYRAMIDAALGDEAARPTERPAMPSGIKMK